MRPYFYGQWGSLSRQVLLYPIVTATDRVSLSQSGILQQGRLQLHITALAVDCEEVYGSTVTYNLIIHLLVGVLMEETKYLDRRNTHLDQRNKHLHGRNKHLDSNTIYMCMCDL